MALKNVYPRTHAGLVSQFGLNFVTEGLIEDFYAKSLAKAETKREKADFDVFYVPSRDESKSLLEDAKEFLNRINRAVNEINDLKGKKNK